MKQIIPRFKRLVYSFSLVVLICACSGPRTYQPVVSSPALLDERRIQAEIAAERYVKQYQYVDNVSYRVMRGSAPLCQKSFSYDLGFDAANYDVFPSALRPAVNKLYGVSDRLTIISVPDASPAKKARLKVGDVLLKINGYALPRGPGALKKVVKWARKTIKGPYPVDVEVMRGRALIKTRFTPAKVCNYPVQIASSNEINAFADGKHVVLTSGLLRFVESDDELAIIVAHELAHNVMGHVRSKRTGAILGTIADIAVETMVGLGTGGTFQQYGALRHSVAFESEADYVGLYMMALSGYDYHKAPYIWRRMAAEDPASLQQQQSGMLYTHPTNASRFVALDRAAREIDEKRARGVVLRPNMRGW